MRTSANFGPLPGEVGATTPSPNVLQTVGVFGGPHVVAVEAVAT